MQFRQGTLHSREAPGAWLNGIPDLVRRSRQRERDKGMTAQGQSLPGRASSNSGRVPVIFSQRPIERWHGATQEIQRGRCLVAARGRVLSGAALVDLGYAPNSDQVLHRTEMSRWVRTGSPKTSFEHSRRQVDLGGPASALTRLSVGDTVARAKELSALLWGSS
jgi:hypothetical protein